MSCIYGPHQHGTEDQGWVAHFLMRAMRGPADHDLRRRQAGARHALRRGSGRRAAARRAAHAEAGRPGLQHRRRAGQHRQPARADRRGSRRCTARRPAVEFGDWRAATSATTCRTATNFGGRRAGGRGSASRRGFGGCTTGCPRASAARRHSRRRSAPRRRCEDRAGQPALVVRGQHLLRVPRAASAARVRLCPGAARRGRTRGADLRAHAEALDAAGTGRAGRRASPRHDRGDDGAELPVLALRAAGTAGAAATLAALAGIAATTVAVGPHGSTTPRATLRKLGVDAVVMGECEEVLLSLAETPRRRWARSSALCRRDGGDIVVQGGPQAADMTRLPALRWPAADAAAPCASPSPLRRGLPATPGAEIEVSRGCPYHCTFCAKDNFRDRYRRRPIATILDEMDGLIAAGVDVRLLHRRDLPALARTAGGRSAERPVEFGVQTRIDLWRPEMLDLLGRAGCVSIEAGVESLSAAGRDRLDKDCRLSTDELTERLVHAKRSVPFVQANLIASGERRSGGRCALARNAARRKASGRTSRCRCFRTRARRTTAGSGACPTTTPGSGRSTSTSTATPSFSDIQEARPRRLTELELPCDAGEQRPPADGPDDSRRGRRRVALTRSICAPRCREIRFVLAVMGPTPSAAQRAAVAARSPMSSLRNMALSPGMDAGRRGISTSSRHWLRALARGATAPIWCTSTAMRRRATIPLGRPPSRSRHSDVLSWWRAVHRKAAPREWGPYRRKVVAGLARRGSRWSRRPRRCSTIWRGNYGSGRRPGPASSSQTGSTSRLLRLAAKRAVIMAAGRLWDEAKNLALLASSRRSVDWPV